MENKLIQFESLSISDLRHEKYREIFSGIHSMKGSAQAFQFDVISTICHLFEDDLLNISKGLSESYSTLFEYLDAIKKFSDEYLDKKEQMDLSGFRLKYKIKQSKEINEIKYKAVPISILIVGLPDSINKQALFSIKSLDNITVNSVKTISEAFACLHKYSFDVILSSNQLQYISGVSFCSAIKQEHSTKSPFFIINPNGKLTFESIAEELRPDLIIQRNEHFMVNFRREIQEFQENKFHYNSSGVSNIFFLDDSVAILELYKEICSENFKIKSFFHNSEKFKLTELFDMKPDIFICDVCIPGIDVVELYHSIRKNTRYAKLPIIFITGDCSQPICSTLLDLGATAIIEKTSLSLDFFEILKRVRIIL